MSGVVNSGRPWFDVEQASQYSCDTAQSTPLAQYGVIAPSLFPGRKRIRVPYSMTIRIDDAPMLLVLPHYTLCSPIYGANELKIAIWHVVKKVWTVATLATLGLYTQARSSTFD